MKAVLHLEGVAVSRGARLVIGHVDARIAPGDALILRGRNGAGKSTLLRAIAGLLPLDGGRIAVTRMDAAGMTDDETPPVGAFCHLQGHQDALKGALSVEENLRFWKAFYGRPHESATGLSPRAALERLALDGLEDLPASFLSQGQRRRLALARLLVARRPIWLLDEPSAALDTASEALFCALVEEHRQQGGMALIASHQPLDLKHPRHLDLTPADAGEAA